ncbi:MAG: metalloregulator ArsR/SmtB family transcription factor [Armatimonadetes bacterium]|nr:metalloregulator ArsR/SmtB family transcription factor [Armatimonadota bacterium]
MVDEIIVRVARAIASLPRLRLLVCLARKGEMNPNALAAELAMPLNALSAHLRTLVTAGLLQRRKSGAWCYYRFESPYGAETLSGRLAAWLKIVLGKPQRPDSQSNPGLHEVRDYSSGAESSLLETIFEAATAFTDLRRLQIFRHLCQHKQTTVGKLVVALSMSEQAASRHTSKLRRRGYLLADRGGQGELVFELSREFKTPVHAEMLATIHAAWKQRQSRTS